MRAYAFDASDTNTDNLTGAELRSTTSIRPRIYDLIISSRATPAEQSCGYDLQRTTTAGTATAVTPVALDPGDPAALAAAAENFTAEPLYTSPGVLLHVDVHQKATFRWVAVPGRELVLPAAANGVGLRHIVPTTAFAYNATIHFEE